MANFYYPLSDEQKLILQTVKEFAEQEIEPRLPEIHKTNAYPWDLFERMGDLGLYYLMLPEEMGGGGHGVSTIMLIGEEIGKVSAGMSFAATFSLDGPLRLATMYTKLKDKYFEDALKGKVPIVAAGCDPAGSFNYGDQPVFGVQKGDEWILNGTRVFATFGGVAKMCLFMGKGEDGVNHYWYVDACTPGIEVSKVEDKIGWKGHETAVMTLKDVHVPADQVLPFPDPRNADRMGLNTGYMSNVAAAVGGMQGVFEKTLEYVKVRNSHGEPIGNMSVVGDQMARMATQIEMCRCLFHNMLMKLDQGREMVPPGLVNMLKAQCIQTFIDVSLGCTELWGGLGIVEDTGITRYVRDAVNQLPPCRPANGHYQQIASLMGLGVKKTLSD